MSMIAFSMCTFRPIPRSGRAARPVVGAIFVGF